MFWYAIVLMSNRGMLFWLESGNHVYVNLWLSLNNIINTVVLN